ncbi:MAG: hypothetical protein AB1324_03225 [Candidatus Micrarchaeota archaeon]
MSVINRSIIDRILNRSAEEIARKNAMREFKKRMPKSGSLHELEESALVGYYNARFGTFEESLDRWEAGHASALRANPQLRRIDVIADAIFQSGMFRVLGAGPVFSRRTIYEGNIAVIGLNDRAGLIAGRLTLDIGGDVRFSKLVFTALGGDAFVVQASLLDGGMAIEPASKSMSGGLPKSIHDRAAEGSEVFQTLSETLVAIDRILRGEAPYPAAPERRS